MIAKIDPNLDELYLGESLKTTTHIRYSFHDEQPCHDFDDALQALGAQFELAEQPSKVITLTPEMIKALQAGGFPVAVAYLCQTGATTYPGESRSCLVGSQIVDGADRAHRSPCLLHLWSPP